MASDILCIVVAWGSYRAPDFYKYTLRKYAAQDGGSVTEGAEWDTSGKEIRAYPRHPWHLCSIVS